MIEYQRNGQEGLICLMRDRPFYQVPGFDIGTPHPVHKLALERSAGNNKILFDHRMDDEPELVSLAEAARML